MERSAIGPRRQVLGNNVQSDKFGSRAFTEGAAPLHLRPAYLGRHDPVVQAELERRDHGADLSVTSRTFELSRQVDRDVLEQLPTLWELLPPYADDPAAVGRLTRLHFKRLRVYASPAPSANRLLRRFLEVGAHDPEDAVGLDPDGRRFDGVRNKIAGQLVAPGQ